MAIDTSVKVFTSAMTGAPVLNGVAGSLLSILDACLVDGWGTLPITSINVSNGVATVSFSSPHPYIKNSVIRVSGANQSQINGDWKVSSIVSANSICFICPAVSDGAMTGSMSGGLAPAGFMKKFSDTNVRAYCSSSVKSYGKIIYVNDSAQQYSTVMGYESMSDINTGSGKFPTAVQMPSGLFWVKSDTASSSSRKWALIADDRFILLYLRPSATSDGGVLCFGDPNSVSDTDSFSTVISGAVSGTSYYGMPGSLGAYGTTLGGMYVPRDSSGFGSALQASKITNFMSSGTYTSGSSYGSYIPTFPNPSNNGLVLSPIYCIGGGLRSVFPGVKSCPQNIGANFFDYFSLVDGGDGKSYMAIPVGEANAGTVFIDVTGPWR